MISVNPACSHSRAHMFFTASVISDRIFGARQCESLAQCTKGDKSNLKGQEDNKMGFHTDVTKKRDVDTMYYLETNIRNLGDVPWNMYCSLPLYFFFTTYYILYLQILFVVLNDLSVILIKFEVIHHIEMNTIFSSREIYKCVCCSTSEVK